MSTVKVEVVEKYFWEEGMWYIVELTEGTKKSVLQKLFPAATEFGHLTEKASLWQPVCINELFLSDRMWSFKVPGILNIFTW